MQELPSIKKLPARMNQRIGNIIVGFAFYEYVLTRISYELLEINPKQGRIAIRSPRGHELVEMVRDLCDLAGIKIDLDFDAAISLSRYVNTRRDLVAHGVWLQNKSAKKIMLLRTRGSWNPEAKKSGSVKRALHPEGEVHTLQDLKSIEDQIEILIKTSFALKKQVSIELLSLRKKQSSQSHQKSRSRNPSHTEPKRSQKASTG